VLGAHVGQAGSEVAPERLRFDYTQPEKPTAEQLRQIEELVNAQVMLATPVMAVVKKLDEARAQGFVAMFGEKYGEQVRTLQVGEFSKELCGGTHVRNSGNIGLFRITTETAISAGTRRIEAVTGTAALQLAQREREQLQELAQSLKVPPSRLGERVRDLGDELKKVKKELEQATAPDLGLELERLRAAVVEYHGQRSLVFERPGLQAKDAQELLKRAQQALAPLAAVLLAPGDSEVMVAAAVSPELLPKVKAGDLIKTVTQVLGGGGGGRPEFAQGKGLDRSKLASAKSAAETALQKAGLRA
jgi:alanyl-tRNA synthetase